MKPASIFKHIKLAQTLQYNLYNKDCTNFALRKQRPQDGIKRFPAFRFLMFSVDLKRDQWHEMGYVPHSAAIFIANF